MPNVTAHAGFGDFRLRKPYGCGSVNRAKSTRLLPSRDRKGAVSLRPLSTLPRDLLRLGTFSGMVSGMATQKITVTLDGDRVKEIRALVAAGQAAKVSAFVQHAVGVALHDAAGWKEMLADGLRQTGGALTKNERAWADALLTPREKMRVPKKGKAA